MESNCTVPRRPIRKPTRLPRSLSSSGLAAELDVDSDLAIQSEVGNGFAPSGERKRGDQSLAIAKEQREARRRRILEKSADRLAFITGERSTLGVENCENFDPLLGNFSVGLPKRQIGQSGRKSRTAQSLDHLASPSTSATSTRANHVPPEQDKVHFKVESSFLEDAEQVLPSRESNSTEFARISTNTRSELLSSDLFSDVKGKPKSGDMSNAVESTASVRLLLHMLASIITCFQTDFYKYDLPTTSLSRFIPRWPIIFVICTDLLLVFTKWAVSVVIQNTRKTKETATGRGVTQELKLSEGIHTDGSGEGQGPILENILKMANRLNSALELVMFLYNLFHSIVFDVSVSLVVICCIASTVDWVRELSCVVG